jgi:hypothetical protein
VVDETLLIDPRPALHTLAVHHRRVRGGAAESSDAEPKKKHGYGTKVDSIHGATE